MADDWHHVAAKDKAPQRAKQVAKDKPLRKAMAEVMKGIADVENWLHFLLSLTATWW